MHPMAWEKKLEESISTIAQLGEYMELAPKKEKQLQEIMEIHPMRITQYYMSLIDKNDPNDPIRKMAVPSEEELNLLGSYDTSGERENTKMLGLQHKYSQTALILATNRCATYCRYCIAPETPVLMGDYSWKKISEVRVGDIVLGTIKGKKFQRIERATVLDKWSSKRRAYLVKTDKGEIVASEEHRFWSEGRWYKTSQLGKSFRTRHIMMPFRTNGTEFNQQDYKLGYIQGIFEGDGTYGAYLSRDYRYPERNYESIHYPVYLRMKDIAGILRTKRYLKESGLDFNLSRNHIGDYFFWKLSKASKECYEKFKDLMKVRKSSLNYSRGYLAGIYDAEGSFSCNILRFCNKSEEILERIMHHLETLKIPFELEGYSDNASTIRILGQKAIFDFFLGCKPTISKKTELSGKHLSFPRWADIEDIATLDSRELIDIETTTGNFIASGFLVHNCFRKRLVGLPTEEILHRFSDALKYIEKHREINNVLISGGDPFVLSTVVIREFLEKLSTIPHLDFIRFGTRVPVTFPDRILEDEELLTLLENNSLKNRRIYVVTQFNHPREITQKATDAVDALIRSGVIVNNQTVLLKGVNDDPETLAELQNKLIGTGVNPYYVFQCRPVKRVKNEFQVPLYRGYEIVETAKKKLNGHSKRFKYIMSHQTGKIEIVGIIANYIYLKYHQAKAPKDIGKFFKRKINKTAGWLDELE